jgi:branched-chain amino acid transport system substrate-binding protein
MMTNGFAMQAAANLAVADINEGGGINGKPLRIIIYDSGSNPDQAALFAERMITLDCVAAIVGVFHSDVALAVKDVAVQYHIPVIFADPYADEVTADLDKEVFRIAPTRSMLIDMMGDWLQAVGDYNQDGEVFAVVLTENSAYGQARLQTIETELPGKGVRVAGFAIDLPTTDFSPIIARIVALDKLPDFVLLYLHNGEVMGLMKQLLDAGIGPERNTLLVATPKLLDDTQFWQQVPNGNYVIAMQIGPWHSTVTPLGQNFAQAFNQYFQRWPEASAFEAYDAVWLIADAIDRADSLAPDAVISTLEQTDITLASGHYTFPYGSLNPPDGTNVPHYLWHQWPVPQVLYLQYTQPNQPAAQMSVIWPPAYRTTDSPIAPALLERSTLARQQR